MLFNFCNRNIVAAIFLIKQHAKWTVSIRKNCIIAATDIE